MSNELRDYLNKALDLETDYLTTQEEEYVSYLYLLLSQTLLERISPKQLLTELLIDACVFPELISDLTKLITEP